MDINIYPVEEIYDGNLMSLCVRRADENLPEWYKKSKSYIDGTSQTHKDKGQTIKRCMPIFDYLSAGINLHLPFSIYSSGIGLNKQVTSSTENFNCKLGHHSPEQKQLFPISTDYHYQPFKVDFPFYIEAPSGYSAVYIPYYPYEGYPLLFLGATVEIDKYKAPVNFPFFIRNDFEGKIDTGTLFMKVIFVKREPLKLNYKKYGSDKGLIEQTRFLVNSFGSSFYRNLRFNQIFPN